MARICQCLLVLWNGNGPHSCIINGLSLVLTCHWMVQNQSFKLQRLRWPFSKHAACWGIASPFRNWTDRAFLQSRALGLRTCRYQHQEVLNNAPSILLDVIANQVSSWLLPSMCHGGRNPNAACQVEESHRHFEIEHNAPPSDPQAKECLKS